MGETLFCDLCGANVPLRESFQSITIGTDKVADACLTCGSGIAAGIKKSVAERQSTENVEQQPSKDPVSDAPDAVVAKKEAGSVPPEVPKTPVGGENAGA